MEDRMVSPQAVRLVPLNLAAWFGLFGAPTLWVIHFLVLYAVTEAACPTGLNRLILLGMNGLVASTLLITLLALAGVVAASLAARSLWRAARSEVDREHITNTRRGYMGLAGMLLGGLFFLVIVMESIPVFVLPACV